MMQVELKMAPIPINIVPACLLITVCYFICDWRLIKMSEISLQDVTNSALYKTNDILSFQN